MTINGITIDPAKLMSKNELLEFLRENGEDDRALAKIREQHYVDFGAEIMWRYPISDGTHLGMFIIPVREGIISLPYDAVDKHDGELLELEDVLTLNEKMMQFFIDGWQPFSDDLLSAMNNMQRILRGE